jgi:ABC-type Fe3+ transport system permease subunit
MCIPFEQGEVMAGTIATVSLVTVRVFAVGVFVINALVNLDLLNDENNRAGLGGYANAKEELESVHFWLSIVPSLALSVLALFISVLMQR